tara:strand:+ start:264 stop:710 length:447 start_codon:yes stop_codon:yes gene_type:complete
MEKETSIPTIVLSGAFDPPSVGQVAMIKDASKAGKVVILLNSDTWCSEYKSRGVPFLEFKKRKSILEKLPFVESVIPANDTDGTVCKDLYDLKPDFFGNGGERVPSNTPEVAVCKELGIGMLWFLGDEIDATCDEHLRYAIRMTYDNC